jgi:hypothetical protein
MFVLVSIEDDKVTQELSFDHSPSAEELCNYIDREADIDLWALVENSGLGEGWSDGKTLYQIIEVSDEVNTEWRPDNA